MVWSGSVYLLFRRFKQDKIFVFEKIFNEKKKPKPSNKKKKAMRNTFNCTASYYEDKIENRINNVLIYFYFSLSISQFHIVKLILKNIFCPTNFGTHIFNVL